jgi:glycosyltransferase involved in cell wall biosynthesis
MREPPTLLWERHSLFSDAGWKVHAATGCRWILEVNAPLVEERLRFESLGRPVWARRWERDVLRAAPEIVAVSRWLVDWLRGEIGCQDVRWLPNGVEPHMGDRARGRARLGLGGEPVIGFLGSMKPWHGLDRFLAVLDAMTGVRGVAVGAGPVDVQHPRLLRVGHVAEPETADLVAAMDVALAPYPADAPPWFCPLKVLAYRAQGTPVVATDVGDCSVLVGDAGVVLPAGAEVGALVEAATAWIGRRTPVMVRGWDQVVNEGLERPAAEPVFTHPGRGANA